MVVCVISSEENRQITSNPRWLLNFNRAEYQALKLLVLKNI